jgi:hypothetical protein
VSPLSPASRNSTDKVDKRIWNVLTRCETRLMWRGKRRAYHLYEHDHNECIGISPQQGSAPGHGAVFDVYSGLSLDGTRRQDDTAENSRPLLPCHEPRLAQREAIIKDGLLQFPNRPETTPWQHKSLQLCLGPQTPKLITRSLRIAITWQRATFP